MDKDSVICVIVVVVIVCFVFCVFLNNQFAKQLDAVPKKVNKTDNQMKFTCGKHVIGYPHKGHDEWGERCVARMFTKPNDTVLEFGGGSGSVSAVIQEKLLDKTKHVVVQPKENGMFGGLLALKETKKVCNCEFTIIDHILQPYEATNILTILGAPPTCIVADCENCLGEEYNKNPVLFSNLRILQVERDDFDRSYSQLLKDTLKLSLIHSGYGCNGTCATEVWADLEKIQIAGTSAQSLTVVGTIRNNAMYLPQIFNKLKELEASLQSNVQYIFYENDSKDESVKMTEQFLQNRNGYLISQYGIDTRFPRRTTRLAFARHQLHTASKEFPAKLVMMLDMDDVNINMNVQSIVDTIHNSDCWDVATANQTHRYYDRWALRTDKKMNNCWKNEKCKHFNLNAWLPDKVCEGNTIHKKYKSPIPVLSAFGGLALYKWKYWKDGLFEDPKGDCEHVIFFRNMRAKWPNVRIVILPTLLNN